MVEMQAWPPCESAGAQRRIFYETVVIIPLGQTQIFFTLLLLYLRAFIEILSYYRECCMFKHTLSPLFTKFFQERNGIATKMTSTIWETAKGKSIVKGVHISFTSSLAYNVTLKAIYTEHGLRNLLCLASNNSRQSCLQPCQSQNHSSQILLSNDVTGRQ